MMIRTLRISIILTRIKFQDLIKFRYILFCIIIFSNNMVSGQNQLNPESQAILSDASTGLVKTTIENFEYINAGRNTKAIQSALNNLKTGQKLLLPEGVYDVETIFIPSGLSDIHLAGTGINQTVLRRKGFSWDNNIQGGCPLHTEILVATSSSKIVITGLTLDGNSHHIAISGYGKWNTTTGEVISGTPQFPTFITTNQYQNSAGSVLNIRLANNITFDSIRINNGFRWAVMLGKLNGLLIQNCIINTGKLSTDFKGHFDPLPNNTVMHMHTSQDGIHLVNVSNAVIQYNDIHSEDSAIAIELNPLWNWGGYDLCENVKVNNNYISTFSPTDPDQLLNDEDVIYGSGLANKWIGQGAVDIFYNEMYDSNGQIKTGGADGPFRNIEIFQNAIDGARYGVRAGFFIGAGTYNATHYNHRIYNIHVHDHVKNYLAGFERNKPAGINKISKDIYRTWNPSGGAGVVIRNTDKVRVENNEIENVFGGLGINVTNVRDFKILNNIVDQVSDTFLGTNWFDWRGGEGIRVWNDYRLLSDPNMSNGKFDADSFLIQGNKIGKVATYKITVIATKNGIVRKNENYDLSGNSMCNISNGVYLLSTENIDTGDCATSSVKFSKDGFNYSVYPNPVTDFLNVESNSNGVSTDYILFDYLGNKYLEYNSSSNKVIIPVGHLMNKLYLLKIANDEIAPSIMRIVKR